MQRLFASTRAGHHLVCKREKEGEEGAFGRSHLEASSNWASRYNGPSAHTILHCVNVLAMTGCSPLKQGPHGNIHALAYCALCNALEIIVRIKQLNAHGHEHVLSILSAKANAVVINRKQSMDTRIAKHNNCEDHRIQWTTYKKLWMWFGKDLVELGFAYRDADGRLLLNQASWTLYSILTNLACLMMEVKGTEVVGRRFIFLIRIFPNLERGLQSHRWPW